MFPLKSKVTWFSVPVSLIAVLVKVLVLLTSNLRLTSATTEMNTNLSQKTNMSNIQTRSPPPAKSLFNSQLFQSDNILGGVMKTFVNSLPLRESYIAFEQAHPTDTSSSQEFDQYFKPSKFPTLGYDQSTSSPYFSKLQNSYSYSPPPPSFYQPQHQQSSYYMPFSPAPPPPPPPPPQPFLKLVKIPGDLKIILGNVGGRNTLEVVCEFPPYLLVVQQIYWHVIPPPSSLLLPYGTFYDSRNGFAPRVTVTSISKWKSVLTVRDYSPDDYGTYRCVSTAILPEEPEPSYSVQLPRLPPIPPTPYYVNFPHHHDSLELRSAASMLSSRQIENEIPKENGETMTSASTRRERRIKFLRKKREIGAFGVHAPFFKPHYGVYRVFKEIKFYGEPFGLGSDLVSNTLNSPESLEKGTGSATVGGSNGNGKGGSRESRDESQQRKNGGRRFDMFSRTSKVLF